MLWQIIQYIVVSIAEIFVSVSALVFAYSQSPKRYKVTIVTIWYLAGSFGDLIIILVAKARLTDNQVC
jgi:dipeptide/tripeptide permease